MVFIHVIRGRSYGLLSCPERGREGEADKIYWHLILLTFVQCVQTGSRDSVVGLWQATRWLKKVKMSGFH